MLNRRKVLLIAVDKYQDPSINNLVIPGTFGITAIGGFFRGDIFKSD